MAKLDIGKVLPYHKKKELKAQYGNPYPVETAIFQLEAEDLSAEVTRFLFHCARQYMESFTAYGEDACCEWQMEAEDPLLFRMSPVEPGQGRLVTGDRPAPPDRADLLPAHRSPCIRESSCTARTTSTCPFCRVADTTDLTLTSCTSS